MTTHKIPVRQVEETPEETVYLDEKTYQKPPRTSVATLYRQHTLLIGIVVGALVMGALAAYFQNLNFGQIKDDLSRYKFLAQQTKENTETCKALVEKNQGMVAEMDTIGDRLLENIKVGITPRTARVVEDKKEIVGQP